MNKVSVYKLVWQIEFVEAVNIKVYVLFSPVPMLFVSLCLLRETFDTNKR